MKDAVAKLRNLRNGLEHTCSKRERQTNKTIVEFLLELSEIHKLKEVLGKTISTLWTQLSKDSNWMFGVFKLIQKVKDNKEELNDQLSKNRRRDSTFT